MEIQEGTYQHIPTRLISKNSFGLSQISETNYKKLKQSIESDGGNFYHPITVNKDTDGFFVIDGNSRLQALKELGIERAYCCVESLTQKEVVLSAIRMNNSRGEFDKIKLAKLVRDMIDFYDVTEKDLHSILGFEPEEIDAFINIIDEEEDIADKVDSFSEIDDPADDTNTDDILDEEIVVELDKFGMEKLNTISNFLKISKEDSLILAFKTITNRQ